jgi:predicted nuclease with RNAse H fold
MRIVGIDLSGPTNSADTALVCLTVVGGRLAFQDAHHALDDPAIGQMIGAWCAHEEVVVGIDAPLSYAVGGGDRPADHDLRRVVIAAGMRPGSVMPPTLTRMAYLTLRGMSLARSLEWQCRGQRLAIAEVHPGATLALRQAPVAEVLAVKAQPQARLALWDWLRTQYIADLPARASLSDHLIMACASAIAAFDWSAGSSRWLRKAEPPQHPYDVAC